MLERLSDGGGIISYTYTKEQLKNQATIPTSASTSEGKTAWEVNWSVEVSRRARRAASLLELATWCQNSRRLAS